MVMLNYFAQNSRSKNHFNYRNSLNSSGSSSAMTSAITSIESSWGSNNPCWDIDRAVTSPLLLDDMGADSGKGSTTKNN